MSQSDFGDLTSPLDGGDFINNKIEPFRDALHSSHKGDTRPTYVVAGMLWVDDTGTPWVVNMFDGSNDVPLGTLNATTHKFTPSNIPTLWGGSAGGSANAIELTPATPFTAQAAGTVIEFLVTAKNTTINPTVEISGLAAKTIKCSQGVGKVGLPIGALQTGMVARIVYDGTDYILLNVRPHNQGTDIVSAATVNLDTALGDYLHITGVVAITTVTLSQGQQRAIVFDDVLTLTNGASLILPTGANITTAAGDVAFLRGEASGVVRVIQYSRADGNALAVTGGDSETVEGYINSDGTIASSKNISSITDNASGDHTVNYSITMANAKHLALANVLDTSRNRISSLHSMTASSCRVLTSASTTAGTSEQDFTFYAKGDTA